MIRHAILQHPEFAVNTSTVIATVIADNREAVVFGLAIFTIVMVLLFIIFIDPEVGFNNIWYKIKYLALYDLNRLVCKLFWHNNIELIHLAEYGPGWKFCKRCNLVTKRFINGNLYLWSKQGYNEKLRKKLLKLKLIK